MPVAAWKITGDRAVLEGTKNLTQGQEELTGAMKETARESQRLDRLSKQISDRQITSQEKYKKAVADVVQVMNTNRKVTKEMAEVELERLKQQYTGAGKAAKAMSDMARRASADQAAAIAKAQQLAHTLLPKDEQARIVALARYKQGLLEVIEARKHGLNDAQAIEQVRRLRAERDGLFEAEKAATKIRVAEQTRAAEIADSVLTKQQRNQKKYNALITEATLLRDKERLSAEDFSKYQKELEQSLLGGAEREAKANKERERSARASADAAAKAARVAKDNGDHKEAARQRAIAKAYADQSRELANKNRLTREAASATKSLATADDAHIAKVRHWGKLYREKAISQKEFVALVRQSKEALQGAGQAGDKAFGSGMVTQLRNYMLGVGGVMGALQLARGEYDAIRASIEKRANTQITVAGAMKDLVVTEMGLPAGTLKKPITETALDLAAQTGIAPVATAQTLDAMLKYDATNPQLAFDYFKYYGRPMNGMTGGPETIGGTYQLGVAMGGMSPQEAGGLLAVGAAYSPIKRNEKLIQAYSRVGSQYGSFGLDRKKGLALFNAYANIGGDTEGETMRTAASDFPVTVKKFFADKKVAAKMMRERGFKPEDYDTIQEQYDIAEQNALGIGEASGDDLKKRKEFAEALLSHGSQRGASSGAVRAFHLGVSKQGQEVFRDSYSAMSDRDGLLRKGEELPQRLMNVPGEKTAQFNRTLQSSGDLSDVAIDRAAATQEGEAGIGQAIRNFREQRGVSNIGMDWVGWARGGFDGELSDQDAVKWIEAELDLEKDRRSRMGPRESGPNLDATRDALITALHSLRGSIENANRKAPSTSRQE